MLHCNGNLIMYLIYFGIEFASFGPKVACGDNVSALFARDVWSLLANQVTWMFLQWSKIFQKFYKESSHIVWMVIECGRRTSSAVVCTDVWGPHTAGHQFGPLKKIPLTSQNGSRSPKPCDRDDYYNNKIQNVILLWVNPAVFSHVRVWPPPKWEKNDGPLRELFIECVLLCCFVDFFNNAIISKQKDPTTMRHTINLI